MNITPYELSEGLYLDVKETNYFFTLLLVYCDLPVTDFRRSIAFFMSAIVDFFDDSSWSGRPKSNVQNGDWLRVAADLVPVAPSARLVLISSILLLYNFN